MGYAAPINAICSICGYHRSSKQHKAQAGKCAQKWREINKPKQEKKDE